jgi:mono/diheme cytochrome c family protein
MSSGVRKTQAIAYTMLGAVALWGGSAGEPPGASKPSSSVVADVGAALCATRSTPSSAHGGAPAETTVVASEARAAAHQVYATRCAICHGKSGDGRGPTSISLIPRPPDFRSERWNSARSDHRIGAAIVDGGAALGMSFLMPAYPELALQPDVVAELVTLVRGFGQRALASRQE